MKVSFLNTKHEEGQDKYSETAQQGLFTNHQSIWLLPALLSERGEGCHMSVHSI